jgi:hypothetical protein
VAETAALADPASRPLSGPKPGVAAVLRVPVLFVLGDLFPDPLQGPAEDA